MQINAFQSWRGQCSLDLNPAGDTVVYSTKYQYAGALDCIGKRKSDGKACGCWFLEWGLFACCNHARLCHHTSLQIVILDFKTSNFIHEQYALQVRQMITDCAFRSRCRVVTWCDGCLELQLAAYVNAYQELFGNDPEVGTLSCWLASVADLCLSDLFIRGWVHGWCCCHCSRRHCCAIRQKIGTFRGKAGVQPRRSVFSVQGRVVPVEG